MRRTKHCYDMKKIYLLFLMMLTVCVVQATVADTTLVQFGRNHFEGWTYHRQGVVLDNNLISQNRVTLFTANNGDQYTLESPRFSCLGIDSLKVEISYKLDMGFNPTKVAPRIEVLDSDGNVLETVDVAVLPNVIEQNLETKVPVDGLTDVALLFSAPKAKESEENFPAVKSVKVWAVTTGVTVLVPGDVTGDGCVDVSDVNAVINVMLGKENNQQIIALADVTGDGDVDVSDVNAIINIMLGKA